jgi:hypothetical protein
LGGGYLLGELCRSICLPESIASSSPYPLRGPLYVVWSCPGRPSGTLTASTVPPGPLHNVGCSGLFCVKLKLTSGPGPRDSDHIPNRARNHSNGGTAFDLPAGVASGEAGKHHLQLDNLRLMASPKRITGPLSCIPSHSRHQSFRLDRFGIMESSPPRGDGAAVCRDTINW